MTSIATFPNDIQYQILWYLDWKSLLNIRSTNIKYRDYVTSCCDEMWKFHHDRRWKNGKRCSTDERLVSMGIYDWSRENNWSLHVEEEEEKEVEEDRNESKKKINWFDEFLRRSRLDQEVHTKLALLIHMMGYNNGNITALQIKNDVWSYLLSHGSDVVDCLLSIIDKGEEGTTYFAMKVLLGVSRCIAFQEWKFLHNSNSSSCTTISKQVEDGAITIEKLYITLDQMISYGAIDKRMSERNKDFVHKELDHLACVIKHRLDESAEIRGQQQQRQLDPIMDVLEEMKYLFDRSIYTLAFRGNTEKYYDYNNSLISECLLRKTGIPITLAIIYISIVKRVCNVHMDIIGLPGHIVVGLPVIDNDNSPRVFIDVFNDAQHLSISDCAELVSQYGVTFHHSMLTPLTNEQVWQRMVANLIHCHSSRLSMFNSDPAFEDTLRLFQMPEYGGNVRIENFNELVSRESILSYHDD